MGFSEAEINKGLEDLEIDVEDTVANSKLTSIFTADEAKGNESIFKDVKSKWMADTLDPIDNEIKVLEKALSPEQKVEYEKLGKNTVQKTKFLAKAVEEALNKPSSDPNVATLQNALAELKAKQETDFVPKTTHEETSKKLTSAQRKYINSQIVGYAKDAVKDEKMKKGKRFADNFVADVFEFLEQEGIKVGSEKVKGTIDMDSGKIVRADDPTRPLALADNSVATLENIIPLVAEYGKYNEGYTPPPATTVVVDVPKNESAEYNAAYAANAAKLAKK